MNKSILTLTICAAAALTACQRAPQPANLDSFYTQRLEHATTFADSVIATDGAFIGGVFGSQVDRLDIENVDRTEILRGMRDAMGIGADNESYVAGVRMGLQIRDIYAELAKSEPISREKFIATIADAFRLDSISPETLQKLQPLYEQTFNDVKLQAQRREDAKIFNTPAAVQNRMMGEAVAEKIMANPDFKAVGSDGVMKRVITEGNGEVINPNSVITASISEQHPDSRHPIRALGATPMLAGRPNHPVLQSVIPYMSPGETAEFFVPYPLAYGVSGDEQLGVGPCESVICTVTIAPQE